MEKHHLCAASVTLFVRAAGQSPWTARLLVRTIDFTFHGYHHGDAVVPFTLQSTTNSCYSGGHFQSYNQEAHRRGDAPC